MREEGPYSRATAWALAGGAWGAWVPLGEGWEVVGGSARLGERLWPWDP